MTENYFGSMVNLSDAQNSKIVFWGGVLTNNTVFFLHIRFSKGITMGAYFSPPLNFKCPTLAPEIEGGTKIRTRGNEF